MKKGSIVLFAIIITMGMVPAHSFAVANSVSSTASIIITEIAPGSAQSATDEFVELYNASADSVDISNLILEYKSASGQTWYKKATIDKDLRLASHQYFLLASKLPADIAMTSGLAQSAGNIRIVNESGEVIDQVGWGEADAALVAATSATHSNQSVSRRISTDNSYQNTSDNSQDFTIGMPTPGKVNELTSEVPHEGNVPSSNFSKDIIVNELLPDPLSPLVDNHDEFIELYNDGDTEQQLSGYVLSDLSGHSFKLDGLLIAAQGYLVISSLQSKISLNNSGDEINLLGPDGDIISSSPNYGNAKSGLSWGLTGGSWEWTQVPTPGQLNAAAIADEENIGTTAKTTVKKPAIKKVTAKPKATSSKKASALTKTASAAQVPGSVVSEDSPISRSSNWSWLLIVLGIATIGYGIYEYKPEITIFFHKLRAKLGLGQKTRPKS